MGVNVWKDEVRNWIWSRWLGSCWEQQQAKIGYVHHL